MWYTTPMNTQATPVKRALLSVSDKTGIAELARQLHALDIEIISTGGTAQLLSEEGIPCVHVERYTQSAEMMDGRVKTLHPAILGGILGLRDRHTEDASRYKIPWIDLVVCNFYPFEKTVSHQDILLGDALEQIDIGGPTMVRAAAKNCGWVTVVVFRQDYPKIIESLKETGAIDFKTRRALAAKAFAYTARYDAYIQRYLATQEFPDIMTLGFTIHPEEAKEEEKLLRYGENPHQKAAVYRAFLPAEKHDPLSLLDCPLLQGKRLSFNNLGDAWGALDTIREFEEVSCVVVKHATPCGVAVAETSFQALQKAYETDRMSAYGGIIALNRPCTGDMAAFLSSVFIEVLLAPSYTEEAKDLLRKKKNLRVLETGPLPPPYAGLSARFIGDDLLVQQKDALPIGRGDLKVVTKRVPTEQEIEDMLFAWRVVKHVKSNAIVTASNKVTCGIGGGQVSRVDATRIALAKSKTAQPMVLASDAFFPFSDSIDALENSTVTAVIQPGGSIRDQEVIDACDKKGIAMVFTGRRCFLHG